MLTTNLKHLETAEEVEEILKNKENVVISCGRMGPMGIAVYGAMEQLQSKYPHVAFCDQDFNIPAAEFVKNLPECSSFMGLPFTVYFRNGKVVAARSAVQSKEEIAAILDKEFGEPS